jgi:tight adherence protein B
MVWVAALAGFGLLVVVGGLVIGRRADRSLIERRLGISETTAERRAGRAQGRPSPVGEALDRALARRGMGADLATQLARADMKMTVGEFMSATIILVIAGSGLAFILTRDVVITIVVFLAALFGPRVYVAARRGQRLRAFNTQLSDTINLMVNSLRAGYSVLQAMEAVSREMDPPISEEFGRVVQEQQLGVGLQEALANMLRRIPSDDLDMMITAINVQREVGGNLSEVLDAISYTIRERVRIKGEIRALTAMSRWSGYIVSLVPLILAVVVYLINPEFMSLLFTERCGWMMIGVAVIGMVAGYAVINKIVQIDV